jgi:hypothetical protein
MRSRAFSRPMAITRAPPGETNARAAVRARRVPTDERCSGVPFGAYGTGRRTGGRRRSPQRTETRAQSRRRSSRPEGRHERTVGLNGPTGQETAVIRPDSAGLTWRSRVGTTGDVRALGSWFAAVSAALMGLRFAPLAHWADPVLGAWSARGAKGRATCWLRDSGLKPTRCQL